MPSLACWEQPRSCKPHQRSDVTASAMSSVLAHGCAASAMMKAICFANSSFEGILKGSPTPRLASSSPSGTGAYFNQAENTKGVPLRLGALWSWWRWGVGRGGGGGGGAGGFGMLPISCVLVGPSAMIVTR